MEPRGLPDDLAGEPVLDERPADVGEAHREAPGGGDDDFGPGRLDNPVESLNGRRVEPSVGVMDSLSVELDEELAGGQHPVDVQKQDFFLGVTVIDEHQAASGFSISIGASELRDWLASLVNSASAWSTAFMEAVPRSNSR